MKILAIILLAVSAVSLAEEYNHHSLSASVVPFFFSFIPDIGYKYYLSDNDAIGFSTILAVVNRFTYTRKMGNFGITGSVGYASADFDLDEATTFATLDGEHRIYFGDHFHTRTVAGVLFSGYEYHVVPFLQIGLGFEL